MATANFVFFDVFSEDAQGNHTGEYKVSCDYDTGTLIIQDVNVLNTTGVTHTVTVQNESGSQTVTQAIPNGTNLQVNVASHNIAMINTVRGVEPPVVVS